MQSHCPGPGDIIHRMVAHVQGVLRLHPGALQCCEEGRRVDL